MDYRYGASLHEIEIGIVVPAVIYAPVWLADQRGFLRDEGLTVCLRSFGSTDATTAALRDGVVPVTIGSPEGSIVNALSGGDLRVVSGFVNRPPRRLHSLVITRKATIDLGSVDNQNRKCHVQISVLRRRVSASKGDRGNSVHD